MKTERRAFIKRATLAMAGLAGAGFSQAATPAQNQVQVQHADFYIHTNASLRLPKVNVSRSRVIKETVGLRPFRVSGPRIEKQELGNKTIVHNYGHGGSGWSLSWGSAHMASKLVASTGAKDVAVIGCGVVGLSAATLLQKKGYEVTIYTKDVYPQVTSAMATGTWSPTSRLINPEKVTPSFAAMFHEACSFSFNTFQRMLGLNEVVDWMDSYAIRGENLGRNDFSSELKEKLMTPDLDFYPKPTLLARRENPFKYKYVSKAPTNIFNIPSYLKMLRDDFLLQGGHLKIKTFDSPEDIDALKEKCIVNCTGLGAQEIFGDEELLPVSGQLAFLIPQPELRYRANMGGVYFIPRKDGIMLGGNGIEGNRNTTPDKLVTDRYLDTVSEMMKNLKG
ncbi:MAG: FAD-dependent oxidoreductase [Cyclobacteriaceae bacterium]